MRQVLRVRGIAGEESRQPDDPVALALEEGGDDLRIAGDGARDEAGRGPFPGGVVIEMIAHSKSSAAAENLFSGIAEATSRLLEGYSDDELAFLLEFIERCNTLSHAETIELRKESAASTVRLSARKARKRVRHTVVK